MAKNKFESEFHKRYVGDEDGTVEERLFRSWERTHLAAMTVEEILAEYRKYVGDPEAEFPEELKKELKLQGKINED